jgi:hypothetical protein
MGRPTLKQGPGKRYECRECGDIVQSTHVHHFVSCGCGKIAVDGGSEYTRLLWPGGPIGESIRVEIAPGIWEPVK